MSKTDLVITIANNKTVKVPLKLLKKTDEPVRLNRGAMYDGRVVRTRVATVVPKTDATPRHLDDIAEVPEETFSIIETGNVDEKGNEEYAIVPRKKAKVVFDKDMTVLTIVDKGSIPFHYFSGMHYQVILREEKGKKIDERIRALFSVLQRGMADESHVMVVKFNGHYGCLSATSEGMTYSRWYTSDRQRPFATQSIDNTIDLSVYHKITNLSYGDEINYEEMVDLEQASLKELIKKCKQGDVNNFTPQSSQDDPLADLFD